MDPEEYFARIRKSMLSSACNLDNLGFSMEVNGSRAIIKKERSIYSNNAVTITAAKLNLAGVDSALRTLRNWWAIERNLQARIAAHDWLYGPRDNVQRSYMVDALILKHFELAGVGRDALASLLRTQIGPRPSVEEIDRRMGDTYSSFYNDAAPAYFDYRWRTRLTILDRGFAPLGPLQMRLFGNAGTGMWTYMHIAPGAFYCGGASPAIWLNDRRLQSLPETLLLAYRGKPMNSFVKHPAFDIPGLSISSIKREKNRLTVGLKPLREDLLAPAALARAA